MRTLEERFTDLLDHLTGFDHRPATQRLTEFAEALDRLEAELRTAALPDHRRDELTILSARARTALEHQRQILRTRTVQNPARRTTPPPTTTALEAARRRMNRSRGIDR